MWNIGGAPANPDPVMRFLAMGVAILATGCCYATGWAFFGVIAFIAMVLTVVF